MPTSPADVEIASIYLKSTLGEFISIRARHTTKGIHYRVVDEYGTKYEVPFRSSDETFMRGELIRFIDGTQYPGMIIPPGFSGGLVKSNYALVTDGCETEDAAFFARVTSNFYPELEDYYHQQAIFWMDEYLQEVDSRC